MDKHRPSWCSIRSRVSSPGGWCRTGTSHPRRGGELSHDPSRRLHAGDAADALPRLPVVPRRRSGEVAALQAPCRIERVQGAHEVLGSPRSEEHTSELQSRLHLVCRLLLEKKKKQILNASRELNRDVKVRRPTRCAATTQ